MLAVIHHMLVTERVPLADIIDLAAELTTNMLVIEFVAPDDSMFQAPDARARGIAQGSDPGGFRSAVRRHFEIVRVQHVEGSTRWLYLLKKRA